MTATASEDFKKNLEGGFRYVDKTELLIPLLRGEHETTFLLRPRRFGKTLTLSMIRYFAEDTRNETLNAENRALFQDLKIMEAGEEYTRQMTAYPVISLSLQPVKGTDFETAMQFLARTIQELYSKKRYLLDEHRLEPADRMYFERILYDVDENGKNVTETDYMDSLRRLSEMLRKDSGKKAVVLIDEYDVPLEMAYQSGYYRQMGNIIGPMLQGVLKSNSDNLQFAVVTGCLRVAKEGIYAGLNNPEINTVLSPGKNDSIGFTEDEVRKLMLDSGVGDHFKEVQEWYDGYRYGSSVIYNPWSVIKRIEALRRDPEFPPMNYWGSTSDNAIIRELAVQANPETKARVERAMQGEEITFNLRDNIVCDEMYQDPDNVMNVMLSAGYLTAVSFDAETIRARIPNREVHRVYREKIRDWFHKSVQSFDVNALYDAMESGNAGRMEEILTEEFLSAMSYFDTVEAFYHGVMLTLMQLNRRFLCVSNRESGKGRFDIMAKQQTAWNLAYILEIKVSDTPADMAHDARKGLKQITDKAYVTDLQTEGYRKIMTYSLAFCEKRCRVIQGETLVSNEP